MLPAVVSLRGRFPSILPVSNPFQEFHMGIRIHRSTWRTPLQMIDSWLPPAPRQATVPVRLGAAAQRFVLAGWLNRQPPVQPAATAASSTPAQPMAAASERSPVVQRPLRVALRTRSGRCPEVRDTRVVLSGRMSEVCAELERLAALEPQLGTARN
jgi:hypothetical protein